MEDGLMSLQDVLRFCRIGKEKFYELNSKVALKRVPGMRLWRTRREWVEEWLEALVNNTS